MNSFRYRKWLIIAGCIWLVFSGLCVSGITIFAQQSQPSPSVQEKESSKGRDTESFTPDSTDAASPEDALEMTDINPIKPPAKIERNLKWLYYVLAGGLIAIILFGIFLLFKRLRKRRKQKTFIILSPEEQALNLLDELSDVERMEGKIFYFQLSAILRNYIEVRYAINAPEMTTEELLPMIDTLNIEKSFKHALKSLLQSSDPIKFAGMPAVQKKMQDDLFFAIDFVKQTTPDKIQERDA